MNPVDRPVLTERRVFRQRNVTGFRYIAERQVQCMARVIRQAAVVPYRIRKERIEVALVTNSRGNGWVVPKGSLDDGEPPRAAAIREAEEEAGLLGVLASRPLGRYTYVNGNGPCEVDVYLMRVTDVLDRWPEDDVRERRWMGLADAEACLREELRRFIRAVESALDPDA
jgi:uncharacterized protein